jgi:hypothetical protein
MKKIVLMLFILLISFLMGCATLMTKYKTFSITDPVKFKGIVYRINTFYWIEPNNLIINLTLSNYRNYPIERGYFPDFYLFDENNRRYSESERTDSIAALFYQNPAINPGMSLTGNIFFIVPREYKYKLFIADPQQQFSFAGETFAADYICFKLY